ncbi:MAG: tRNA (adenosine(37)-N6)-threonylcarbamoyltransferase complex ATPase subunit type 1 TsaE [Candidatus Marinimicrobia bacterium]|nr:tRNA (adenosine(37)-N6)-threonylcarbamoyltransferase complex ATPase subunit type 1 TsaE [Candidatus Neomarinimicrobiota bacterium]
MENRCLEFDIDLTGKFVSNSEEETILWGRKFADELKSGDTVFIIGDLGSGKTVIARGIAYGSGYLGIVTSPSFTLQQTYQGKLLIHHCDLYRLKPGDNLIDFGFEEIFDSDAVTIFEWAEDFPIADKIPRWEIRIEIGINERERNITWKYLD